MKKFLLACFLALAPSLAWAACTSPLAVKDATGATQDIATTLDASSNCMSNITGNVGGYNTSPAASSATGAATINAGASVGGLFTVSFLRTNGGSGILSGLLWQSTNGDTTQKLVYIWKKNPTATTCTNGTAFAASATDNANLVTAPFTITPTANPAGAVGDTTAYAVASLSLPISVQNLDSVASKNLYVCVETLANDTLDANHTVYLTLTGPQD